MWTSTLFLIISIFTAPLSALNEAWEFSDTGSNVVPAPALAAAPAPAAKIEAKAKVIAPKRRPPRKAKISLSKLAPKTPNLASLQIAMPMPMPMRPLPKVAIPADEAVAIIQKVQTFYNQTKSFTANFSQTVRNATFGKLRPKTSSGKVYILKPGKMRWDYRNKSRRSKSDLKVSKSFISDGSHLWAVMHKNKQYYKQTLDGSALPVAVSFLMGKGNLLNDFKVSLGPAGKYGSKSDILLLLTPKVPSARYKKLWLVVDSVRYSVKQSVVINSKGDTNSIVFNKVALNSGKLRSGHFIFNVNAHKDYRLVTPPKQ